MWCFEVHSEDEALMIFGVANVGGGGVGGGYRLKKGNACHADVVYAVPHGYMYYLAHERT